jgi:hypothetical protein
MNARSRPSHERIPATLPGPPERPARPSNTKPLLFVIALFGVLGLLALSRCQGQPATISAKGIGPIEIGKATTKEMQTWATGPVTFWFVNKGDPPPPVHFSGRLWQYECVGRSTIFGAPCRTLFGLRNGRVVTVETSNPLFHTKAGTYNGTALPRSRERERAKWSGWKVKCPHLVLRSPKDVVFLASVSKNTANPQGFVTGFYLSVKPGSFAFCAEK